MLITTLNDIAESFRQLPGFFLQALFSEDTPNTYDFVYHIVTTGLRTDCDSLLSETIERRYCTTGTLLSQSCNASLEFGTI